MRGAAFITVPERRFATRKGTKWQWSGRSKPLKLEHTFTLLPAKWNTNKREFMNK